MFLSRHTKQRITQPWGHSACHSHDTGRDRRTQSRVEGEGQRSFTHRPRHHAWFEVFVDVLGKQWPMPVRCAGSTFTLILLVHPIHQIKTSFNHTENVLIAEPFAVIAVKNKNNSGFGRQNNLCICGQYGQWKGSEKIHHRKEIFPSMALSFFVFIKRIFQNETTLTPKQLMGSLSL